METETFKKIIDFMKRGDWLQTDDAEKMRLINSYLSNIYYQGYQQGRRDEQEKSDEQR